MGTCGRKRGIARLCSFCVTGLLVLAVLAGVDLLAPARENWSGLGQFIVAPAEARKPRAAFSRRHGRVAGRALPGGFDASTFAPRRGHWRARGGRARAFAPRRHRRAGAFKAPGFGPPERRWHGWVVRRPRNARKARAFATPEAVVRPPAAFHRSWTGRDTPGHPPLAPEVGAHRDAKVWRTAVKVERDGEAPHVSAGGHEAGKRRATFHRMWRRLSKRRHRLRQARTPKGAPDRGRRNGADRGGARKVARRLGGRPPAHYLPPIGSFRSNEVLAINLGPEGLAKVRGGGYELLGRVELPELGLTVARLRTPARLNAVSGWEKLYELLPEGGFALNRIYAPYRLGAGPGRAGAGVRSAARAKGCAAERCFGTALIRWRAALAACARDVKVGVIDTGFDRGHPAFVGLRYEYKEFLPEGSARASDQHGTGILSLLAGKAGSGTPGLIPHAHFVVANAFFADSDGQAVSDTVQMLQALQWLKARGVAVANLSFAGPYDELMHHGVRQLAKAGIVVVAAAGNEGPSAPPSYPAAYEEVIAVTAVDRKLGAYRYASRGDHIDVAAPGVDVWTAFPGRREGPQTGTSFAVPYVTAVVAVAYAGAELRPDADPLAAGQRARALLARDVKKLGGRGRDPTFGAGLVQAPALCDVSAPEVVAAAPPWAGTVMFDAGEPLVVGSWTSTVHAASGKEMPR